MIKFFTRSFNIELFEKSSALLREAGYPVVRLTDKSADGYFYSMLSDEECDIAVNIDEDCFVTDLRAVLELARAVEAGGYANAGCPDCGSGCPRAMNPIVTNPFFNILNLRLIRTRFSPEAVAAFRYQEHKKAMMERFPKDMLTGKYNFDYDSYEPYYQFFLWLASEFDTLYLPSKRHVDGTTTMLYDPSGRLLCEHTWFARFYTMPTFLVRLADKTSRQQRQRIDNVIGEVYRMRRLQVPKVSKLRIVADRTLRWSIKIPQRLARRVIRLLGK